MPLSKLISFKYFNKSKKNNQLNEIDKNRQRKFFSEIKELLFFE